MGMIAECDGSGKQQSAACHHGDWFKPTAWFERTPRNEAGKQERNILVCSRACIQIVEDKRAAQGHKPMTVVLPI